MKYSYEIFSFMSVCLWKEGVIYVCHTSQYHKAGVFILILLSDTVSFAEGSEGGLGWEGPVTESSILVGPPGQI